MRHIIKIKLTSMLKQIFAVFLTALIFSAAILLVLPVISARASGPDLILFENNELKAVLVIRDKAGLTEEEYEYITGSAALLVKHFRDATGYELPQYTEAEFRGAPNSGIFAGKIKIYLGWNGLNPHPDLAQTLIDLNAEADNDGNHGYVFAPYSDNVVIQSPTPLGVRYAAAAFLRKYLDVEWLMPGPYGADTPVRDRIAIPCVLESSAPAFNMRYAWNARPDVEWMLNQGLQSHSQSRMENFSHALLYYFDPDKYFDEHPEYYPIHNGEHYRPTDGIAWQPRFSEPGTIDVAASEIIALLKADPNIVSVSLGVNDSGGYCEKELAEQKALHGLNSEGLVHMTDLFCKWSNAVIEKVLAAFPGRNIKFGMIAYRNLNDPPKEPGLKFHESMIPYITKDRSAWMDPVQKAQGHRITLDWLERCSQLGWYNYEYGSAYLVPRIYTATMQEYMQFAEDSGVKYIFAETMFSIDEGPKPHLFAMLNWDPDCNVQDLENRWYRKAVGPQAAPHLAAFYKVWEEIWTEDIPQGEWFEDCKNFTYLQFFYTDYLGDVPLQKLKLARLHLDNAWAEVQKSGSADQEKRLEAIREFYALEEATVLAYPRSYGDLTQTEAMEVLSDGFIEKQLQMREKVLSMYSALLKEADPLINHPEDIFEEALSEGNINPSPFWAVADYVENNEANGGPVTDRILELAAAQTHSYGREFCRLIAARLRGENLILDPSFEEGAAGDLGNPEDAWTPWISGDVGTLTRIENPDLARSGSRSIKAYNNRPLGALIQSVPVRPGLFAFRVHYYTAPSSRPDAVMWLNMDIMDSEGNILQYSYSWDLLYGLKTSPGKWLAREIVFEVPESFDEKKVAFVNVWAMLEEQNDVPLYWDDAEAYQAADGFDAFENPFADVSGGSYYYEAVLWALKNNITKGTSATTFSPDAACTRAQMVTFLWNAAGKPEPETTNNPFADLGESSYYYNAVLWAVEKGITKGTSESTFSPDATCTRAQAVTFLWNYAGKSEPAAWNPFGDINTGDYYYKAVLWAAENGITSGTGKDTYGPSADCTRAQIVTFLYRLCFN